jgi:hypothetical protein
VFANGVLNRVFGLKEMRRKQENGEDYTVRSLIILYFSPNFIRVITSRGNT